MLIAGDSPGGDTPSLHAASSAGQLAKAPRVLQRGIDGIVVPAVESEPRRLPLPIIRKNGQKALRKYKRDRLPEQPVETRPGADLVEDHESFLFAEGPGERGPIRIGNGFHVDAAVLRRGFQLLAPARGLPFIPRFFGMQPARNCRRSLDEEAELLESRILIRIAHVTGHRSRSDIPDLRHGQSRQRTSAHVSGFPSQFIGKRDFFRLRGHGLLREFHGFALHEILPDLLAADGEPHLLVPLPFAKIAERHDHLGAGEGQSRALRLNDAKGQPAFGRNFDPFKPLLLVQLAQCGEREQAVETSGTALQRFVRIEEGSDVLLDLQLHAHRRVAPPAALELAGRKIGHRDPQDDDRSSRLGQFPGAPEKFEGPVVDAFRREQTFGDETNRPHACGEWMRFTIW